MGWGKVKKSAEQDVGHGQRKERTQADEEKDIEKMRNVISPSDTVPFDTCDAPLTWNEMGTNNSFRNKKNSQFLIRLLRKCSSRGLDCPRQCQASTWAFRVR